MTDNEKYYELLKEIGELIAGKNAKIALLEWEVASLKNKIAEIESGKVCAKRIEVRKGE